MDTVDGYWVGAMRHGRGVDLVALAERMGGFEALKAGGIRPLVAAGVEAARATAWVKTGPESTLGTALTLADPAYPKRLRAIPGAPPVILCEGAVEVLNRRAVGVVGTRRCTSYGSSVARSLGSALAAAGVAVVSGLARGVDTHAHRAAVSFGATIAVLGHGLAYTAPLSNVGLRRAIVERGGLVVSTWLDRVEPRPFRFPMRNRWIAGLADAVVVVEAPMRSGALITARQMLELGREVYAVPGSIRSPVSAGCNSLIQQGAHPIVDVDAFVAYWGDRPVDRLDEPWVNSLCAGATVDEIARHLGRPVAELLAELTMLELRGEVVRLPGQRYARGGALR